LDNTRSGKEARPSPLTLDGKQKGKSEVKILIVSAVFAVLACMPISIAEVGAKAGSVLI
jgi:hypothetical protein